MSSNPFAGRATPRPPPPDPLAVAVFDAALEVQRHLGHAFTRDMYQKALAAELQQRHHACVQSTIVQVLYKGVHVGHNRLDLLVEGRLVVSVQAEDSVVSLHREALRSTLLTTGHPLGMLLNFRTALAKTGLEQVLLQP